MRICFQSDLKDCPDLRHAGQRLLSKQIRIRFILPIIKLIRIG